MEKDYIAKSRHTVVWHAAQENGACANGVSILTETTKLQFSHIRSSMMFYPNGTKFTVAPNLQWLHVGEAISQIFTKLICFMTNIIHVVKYSFSIAGSKYT